MNNTWSQQQEEFLKQNYPIKGLFWCSEHLNKSKASIRAKASRLKLRQDKDSDFFKSWQSRAALSKVGKKRPEQSIVMKNLHINGKLAYDRAAISPQVFDKARRLKASEAMKEWHKNNPHPKGAKGMKHTEETKKIISEKAKRMWANMTEEQLDGYSKRAAISGLKNNMNRTNSSWKSGWREIGGYKKYYRSRWEANYARYLEWMKSLGQIKEWQHESKTFWFDGIKRGCMSYLPDFRVIDFYGDESYHEVKGWMDDRSKTKIKRMAKYHPDVKLIIVDGKEYKALEKSVSKFIQGWE